jgi:hypothetical protein
MRELSWKAFWFSRKPIGSATVQDKDRLYKSQRSEVQSDGLHRGGGDVDCYSDQPEPVNRQISKEPKVQRRPLGDAVRGVLLDDIRRAKRDGACHGNKHRDLLVHGCLTPRPQSAGRRM